MTAVSKNVYFEVLNIIIDKYNKTFYIKIQYDTIKIHLQMLDLILMLNTMLNLMNLMNPRFKVDDHVRSSKYKDIFAKGYTSNCQIKFLLLAKLKRKLHGEMFLVI